MFNTAIVKQTLLELVGWRNNTLSTFILDSENSNSESGMFFNEGTPLSNLANLYYTIPEIDLDDTDFNSYLKQLNEAAIIKVLNSVFSNNSPFIMNVGNILSIEDKEPDQAIEPNTKRGLEIILLTDFGAKINSIDLYGNESKDVEITLINKTTKQTEQSKTIQLGNGEIKTYVLNWYLEARKGNKYYIMIDDDQYTQPIFNYSGSYPNNYYIYFQPNIITNDIVHSTPYSYAFSVNISLYKDWTDFITSNKHLFSNALVLEMGVAVLKQVLNSTRSNIIERLTSDAKALAYEGLNGNEGENGIITERNNAIRDIKNSVFNMNRLNKSTLR